MLISHKKIVKPYIEVKITVILFTAFINLCAWETFNWAIIVLEQKGNNKQMLAEEILI